MLLAVTFNAHSDIMHTFSSLAAVAVLEDIVTVHVSWLVESRQIFNARAD